MITVKRWDGVWYVSWKNEAWLPEAEPMVSEWLTIENVFNDIKACKECEEYDKQ